MCPPAAGMTVYTKQSGSLLLSVLPSVEIVAGRDVPVGQVVNMRRIGNQIGNPPAGRGRAAPTIG